MSASVCKCSLLRLSIPLFFFGQGDKDYYSILLSNEKLLYEQGKLIHTIRDGSDKDSIWLRSCQAD